MLKQVQFFLKNDKINTLEPVCFKCKHFNAKSSTCPAFKGKKIPIEIVEGKNHHTKPLPNQGNNIVFELKIVSSNYRFEMMHLCETCMWYLSKRKCFAFDSIPVKFLNKMFITNKPNHLVINKEQHGDLVYKIKPDYIGIE